MPTNLTLALLLHPPCASLIQSSASRMLFRRSSPSGSSSQSSSPSSSSTSLAPRLSLTAINVPDTPTNFAAYLADARALVDDFEQGLTPSSSTGWKAESAHGVEARVASCKGSRLASTTKEVVDDHETWIGRVSEHDDVTYDDFLQVSRFRAGFRPFPLRADDWLPHSLSCHPQHMLKDEEGKGGQHVAELPAANVISTYDPSTLPDGLHSAAIVHIPQLDMPFPLAGRAFLSLVVTAKADDEFWNVSVPVQDDAFPVSPDAFPPFSSCSSTAC